LITKRLPADTAEPNHRRRSMRRCHRSGMFPFSHPASTNVDSAINFSLVHAEVHGRLRTAPGPKEVAWLGEADLAAKCGASRPGGDIRMNCDAYVYRVVLPGHDCLHSGAALRPPQASPNRITRHRLNRGPNAAAQTGERARRRHRTGPAGQPLPADREVDPPRGNRGQPVTGSFSAVTPVGAHLVSCSAPGAEQRATGQPASRRRPSPRRHRPGPRRRARQPPDPASRLR
jgi:hypothetical protein